MARKTTSSGSTSGSGGGASGANPMADMMAMFDPQRVAAMFDPQKMMGQMGQMGSMSDMSSLIDANRRQYEAMVAANQAAAGTYRDMLEKQMEIFNRMTTAAQDYAGTMESPVNPGAVNKNAEATTRAAQTAFDLMREMAEAAKSANEQVFQEAQKRMTDAIEEMKAPSDGPSPTPGKDDSTPV
ncbi:hypothetical protein E0K89_005735 [Aquicoccus sp. SCR17]|nr:hypothetical protein [Carideicomes alvinocaridis]